MGPACLGVSHKEHRLRSCTGQHEGLGGICGLRSGLQEADRSQAEERRVVTRGGGQSTASLLCYGLPWAAPPSGGGTPPGRKTELGMGEVMEGEGRKITPKYSQQTQ